MVRKLRLSVFCLATLALATLGCDTGIQRGKFTVSSSSVEALTTSGAWITKFAGTPGQTPAGERALLVAVLWLGDRFESGGSSESHGTYISTYESGVGTIRWDRRSDEIIICGSNFDRSNGNIFIVRSWDAVILVEQLDADEKATDTNLILDRIKSAYPADSAIQELTGRPSLPD